jgi:hypothetical protein
MLEPCCTYFTTLGIRVFTRFFAVLRLANATFSALGGVASTRLPTALEASKRSSHAGDPGFYSFLRGAASR